MTVEIFKEAKQPFNKLAHWAQFRLNHVAGRLTYSFRNPKVIAAYTEFFKMASAREMRSAKRWMIGLSSAPCLVSFLADTQKPFQGVSRFSSSQVFLDLWFTPPKAQFAF